MSPDNLLTISWLFPDYLLTISWLSPDYLLTIFWLSSNYLLTISWLSPDYLLNIFWLFPDCLWMPSIFWLSSCSPIIVSCLSFFWPKNCDFVPWVCVPCSFSDDATQWTWIGSNQPLGAMLVSCLIKTCRHGFLFSFFPFRTNWLNSSSVKWL